MHSIFTRWIFAALLLSLTPGALLAQRSEAFCALRDPNREIRLLASEYASHESLVRTITRDSRTKILEEVPFPIHFDELGQHTLYKVMDKTGKVLGFVHVRSESFSWGLVRIAWMMDLDLDITGYCFRRCRSPHRTELEAPITSKQIVGKSSKELSALLLPEGAGLREEAVVISDEGRELMTVMVKSAIKTKVVTGIVWEREVGDVKAAALAREHLSSGARLKEVNDLYHEANDQALSAHGLGDSIGFDRSGVMSWRAERQDDLIAGAVYCTPWSAGNMHAKLWWVLGSEGEILAVEDPQRSLDERSMANFKQLVGRTFKTSEQCGSASELAALEVSLLHAKN